MQADLIGTGLTRTQSTANIVDRLGNGRRRLNRANMSNNARGRSNSRQRLELRTRSNSRASQRRSNSQSTPLRRTDSRQSLRSMKRSNSRQRNPPAQQLQQIGVVRRRTNNRRRINQTTTAAGRKLSTSNLPNRRMSTNGRLPQQPLNNRVGNRRRASTNGRMNTNSNGNNVVRRQRGGAVLNGRILKQKNVNLRGGVRGRGTVNNNQRAIQNRGRSRSR